LTKLLGVRFTTAPAVREYHGKGEAYHPLAPPDGVAYANSTEEVSAIVKACAALDGHALALHSGMAATPTSGTTTVRYGAMRECSGPDGGASG
jgi:FAD/FMN-containing dehydrogenase